MPSTKKQIVIAVILAILGIATILLLMRFFQGAPADELIFLHEGEEYEKSVYRIDDVTLPLENGEKLDLRLIVYLPEKNELQFGFVLPEEKDVPDTEPFVLSLINDETGESVTEKPFYIRESRDGSFHYRAILIGAEIDPEASPDLRLEIEGNDGTPLYSDVFIRSSTLFTEKALNELPVADDRITLVDPASSSEASAA